MDVLGLDDLDSRSSSPSSSVALNKHGFEGISRPNHATAIPSKSFKKRIRKGSEGLISIGRSLGFGVSRAVFAEDLKVSEKKIFDPQDKFLLTWNKFFVVSCILALSVDPLFFYLPVFDQSKTCLGIDRKLAIIVTTLRTMVDSFYLIHMALQFRTAYIAPSSRIVIWRFLQRSRGSDVLSTKQAIFFILLLQYIPRVARIAPLTSELKRTAGVIAETAWAGAAYYLLLYMLASHIVGALWYILSVERNDTCWQRACERSNHDTNFLYCGNDHMPGYGSWSNISSLVLTEACTPDGDNPPFDFGIFQQALLSGIVSSRKFTYLQSLTIRLEEMRVKRRDAEQWMHHRLLPQDLRERVRRYIVREGDPVDEMLFIIRGRLESVTTDGGRSGFFNRSLLKEGDFCGEELLTWALDPKSGSNLPSSTRTVMALREVEAFALPADELKFRRKEEEEEEAALGGPRSLGATFLVSRFAANALRGVQRNRDRDRNLKTGGELVNLPKPPEPDFTADAD
ncbi:Cyclic nucleotide-binding domain-containing protein [Cynara cardunculus var. scolymus]|uniref:Cyclic nucleotide-binding domain-containing protein n=1 Tax=Cynara cardunculus var. scolymus TaxID=59895 RepID=A0A103XMW6_CYNCS|nr:Cyclic nucleotide-binding domain-containing protein [Cynara cardunculus var. scolymus]